MKNNKKKGFTLMELLIVIAIIVVLVAIAIPVFGGQLTKAKQTTDVANIRAAYAEAQTAILSDNYSAETAATNIGTNHKNYNGTSNLTLNYAAKLKVKSATDKTTIQYTADKLQATPFEWVLGEATIN